MPFPANWLEELVVEWLDLLGFSTSTGISVPAGPGGRWSPDVVGAKMGADPRLVIRHCEATMWLISGPDAAKQKFRDKFSGKVEDEVRRFFSPVFGERPVQNAKFEKWVITCQVSTAVRSALEQGVPGIEIHLFRDFVEMVLGTISDWRFERKPRAMLPSDKWLLHMIDQFHRDRLLGPLV